MKIKSIIGIMSCKGGVGKSTLSVNIAVTLSSFLNKKVGLLDADIYGPNHARLLGISDFLDSDFNNGFLKPFLKYNLYSMSFSYFLKPNSSVLLRGPKIGRAHV